MEEIVRRHWVMDYETLANTFVAVFKHYKEEETKIFASCPWFTNHQDFMLFLESNITNKEWHISYNGLAFDSQITHHVLSNFNKLYNLTGEQFAREMYKYAQRTIEKSNRKEFSDYPQWKMTIRQIDVFKANHWDNPAKASSLKWIQYSMDWKNMQEMPIHHTTELKTQEDLDRVIGYCINDVESTRHIFNLSEDQINLRAQLTKKYGIDLFSASETRISKEIFAYMLCPLLGISKSELKRMRTHRSKVAFKDIILPNISFKTPEMNAVLNWFKGLELDFSVITEKGKTKGPKYTMHYKDVRTDYALGGIHGCRESGLYVPPPGWTIMSSDVTSFYPNLAIKNGFWPEHLPAKESLGLYQWIFEERALLPKKDPINKVYKLMLNATYGLSKEANSFLYDPRFTMQITINGQLQLSMLYEMLAEGIPEAVSLMQNTDGLEMMIPESKKEKYMQICSEWEAITKLQLEHDEYSKLALADVNNYIGIFKDTSKTPKAKGRFEWKDLENKEVASLHKNKSFLIIPKAIYAYFVNGVCPEDYLARNKSLVDYCGAVKSKGDWYVEAHSMLDGSPYVEKLSKINRYYISKEGVKLVKVNPDGRKIQVESGKWKQQVVNNLNEVPEIIDSLDVDIGYYLEAIYQEINNIDRNVTRGYTQMSLF